MGFPLSSLRDIELDQLPLVHRGKVRDVFEADDNHLVMIASDRLSAFDVVLPDGIPGKGAILTAISNFWFARTGHLIPNHLTGKTLHDVVPDASADLVARSTVVKKLKPLPVEAIARGYLIGSGWKDYQATGKVCGIALPSRLRQADELPRPIFTPSTKAAAGNHDANIGFDAVVKLIGGKRAEAMRRVTLALYREAAAFAAQRGIIIADTKFEFGLDEDGNMVLMDEVLTPDSSRFWPVEEYWPGASPPSFDKQYVRDYLETLDWDKTAPGPSLPQRIIDGTRKRYLQAWERLSAKDRGDYQRWSP